MSRVIVTSGRCGPPITRSVRSWCLIQKMASLSCAENSGNGVVSTNRTHDIVDFGVIQLSKGILVAQELFVVKGRGHRVGEAKNTLEPFNDNVLAFV